MQSSASSDWGTPADARRLAALILKPAARGGSSIDLDFASSAYWQEQWEPEHRPEAYMDGTPGRDMLMQVDRQAVGGNKVGAGFWNPPGSAGGDVVQACWARLVAEHARGWIDSGFWVGFSLEQMVSLQNVDGPSPLAPDITTIVPSRRCRYLIHPARMIELLEEKLAKRKRSDDEIKRMRAQITKLTNRADDSPVPGESPTHASFFSILWSHDRSIKKRQMDAARSFLQGQKTNPGSLFERAAVVSGTRLRP